MNVLIVSSFVFSAAAAVAYVVGLTQIGPDKEKAGGFAAWFSTLALLLAVAASLWDHTFHTTNVLLGCLGISMGFNHIRAGEAWGR